MSPSAFVKAAGTRSRDVKRKLPRIGSGGRGDDLNADVHPYREDAAAGSDVGAGENVVHGRRRMSSPAIRQERFSQMCHQNKRQIHSIRRDTTSPNTNSTADQMKAETKLAI